MSTNAQIYLEIEPDVYQMIYVHWDGYIEHTGEKLLKHYNTREDVERLIELGNVSFLDDSLECPDGHSFEDRVPGYSVFYGRDREEEDQEAVVVGEGEFWNSVYTGYVYVFSLQDEWEISVGGHDVEPLEV